MQNMQLRLLNGTNLVMQLSLVLIEKKILWNIMIAISILRPAVSYIDFAE